MIDISKFKKEELKEMLKRLKLLNTLIKFLWRRWRQEFNRINNGVNLYKIEYHNFWENAFPYVKQNASLVYKELFWIDVDLNSVTFVSNQSLKWWFRVFYNDDMFDLSYSRFENKMK